MEYFIDSGEKPAIIEYPITQFFLLLVLMILIAIELILKSSRKCDVSKHFPKKQKQRYLESKNKKIESGNGPKEWYKNLTKDEGL